ncbi:MAG: Gfo/Idh/MocA family oxidoreductase [Ruthenibacterium lactatiformans]
MILRSKRPCRGTAYGTRAYPDYDALLADPQVDAVCICTPSHLHAPLALQAVAAGKQCSLKARGADVGGLRRCGRSTRRRCSGGVVPSCVTAGSWRA